MLRDDDASTLYDVKVRVSMTFQKIRFEKHDGFIDYSTGNVAFYKLLFESILHVGDFLGPLEPGNYRGWVQGDR